MGGRVVDVEKGLVNLLEFGGSLRQRELIVI
jgi:hypothetical protein